MNDPFLRLFPGAKDSLDGAKKPQPACGTGAISNQATLAAIVFLRLFWTQTRLCNAEPTMDKQASSQRLAHFFPFYQTLLFLPTVNDILTTRKCRYIHVTCPTTDSAVGSVTELGTRTAWQPRSERTAATLFLSSEALLAQQHDFAVDAGKAVGHMPFGNRPYATFGNRPRCCRLAAHETNIAAGVLAELDIEDDPPELDLYDVAELGSSTSFMSIHCGPALRI